MPGRTRMPAGAGAPTGAADVAGRLRDARLAALLRPTGGSPRTTRADGLDALIARTAEVYSRALTDRTRLSYASRWRQFERWCGQHRFQALPATAETVMMFLADAADGDAPLSLSTLRGRTAAINRVHIEAGHPAPGDDPAMAMLMRGLGRALDRSPRADPISALRISDLREVLRAMQDIDPRLARDRALLALLEARITPEDLSRLRWEDVAMRGSGLRLRLRDRPSHPPSRSGQVAALADDATCPVVAVLAWKTLAGEEPELVFTLVDSTGRRDDRPIHPYNLRRIAATRLDSLGPVGAAATPGEALQLLAGAPSAVLRDRALLLVGFAGAFRRNELCGLRWADVRDDPDGAILRLRRSKTDPAGRGRDVGIPLGRSALTCPVTALHAWRDRTQDQLGSAWHDGLPVLCRVGRAGRIGIAPITPEALTRIVIVRAQAAGVPGHWGGRSLRAGFISTAADLDIPLEQIARQSRHAGLDSLVRYIRAEDPFRRNAADWVGL
jgi:integrase